MQIYRFPGDLPRFYATIDHLIGHLGEMAANRLFLLFLFSRNFFLFQRMNLWEFYPRVYLMFFQPKKLPHYIVLIYLYILIFCAGIVAPIVAGVVAILIAPRRAILLVIIVINYRNHRCTGKTAQFTSSVLNFNKITTFCIIAPYLWIKYSTAECTRI